MRLPDITEKIKQFPDLPKDIFVLCTIILVAFGAFLGGRYSAQETRRAGELKIVNNAGFTRPTQPIMPHSDTTTMSLISSTTGRTAQGMYVGAKSGKTYYLPWCSGAKRIREENKVWFESKSAAEAKRYKPSVNCKGI